MTETKVAWFPPSAFVQLPHAMEPQLHAQVETEAPLNLFHCTLYQVSAIIFKLQYLYSVSCLAIHYKSVSCLTSPLWVQFRLVMC